MAPGCRPCRVVGGLVPPGLLAKIQTRDVRAPESLSASRYHLSGRETVRGRREPVVDLPARRLEDWRAFVAAAAARHAGHRSGAGALAAGAAARARLRPGPAPCAAASMSTASSTRSRTSGRTSRFTCSARAWTWTGATPASRVPPARRRRWCRSCSTAASRTCGRCCPTGVRLRLLRDSTSLAGSAYVEFDLEAIFDGELFAEFLLLWQLCHVSRMEKRGGPDAPAADCWIEHWRGEAVEARHAGAQPAARRRREGAEAPWAPAFCATRTTAGSSTPCAPES